MLPAKEIVEKYLGKEYQFKGFNCYDLARSIYNDVGIELPEQASSMKLHHVFNKVEALHFLDLVAFFDEKGRVTHAGVYIGNGQFIHATKKAGVSVEALHSRAWEERLAGAYRHKGFK